MAFGDRTLFSRVSLRLNPGERYGLVGANGSGKTTLLRILAGDLEPTEGAVSIPKRLRLGVLRQDQFRHENEEILRVALMGNAELWEAQVEMDRLLAAAEAHFDADRFSQLEDIVQRHDGYTAEARAAAILEGLGLGADIHRDPLSTLSGGFKLRVLLAQVLASSPDVLLLDEPTNHLDILSIRWLETFMGEFPGPVVVISHDRRFLDNVATSIFDVDYETVTHYPGNYTDFLERKEAEHTRREKELAAREKDVAHHQAFVDRFRAKASKARQAQSKVRMIEKMAEGLEELPTSSRRFPTFQFEQVRASGRDVLRVKGIKKAYGENEVLHGVDLLVQRGDRLAIMGPNGIGKSTLLKVIMGELKADEGEVSWGYETYPGYSAQDCQELFENPDRTAEEWIWDYCPDKDVGFVRGRMALTLFSKEEVRKRLGALSGGEATRLVLTRLMMERPNVLVLDEPTNHLDLESIQALVQGLKRFKGTLILVSHDRWFVSQLASRVLEIKIDGLLDYKGTYEEYVHFCGDDHLDADRVILKARKEKKEKRKDGLGKAEGARRKPRSSDTLRRTERKRALEREEKLLARIEEMEARLGEIDAAFCAPTYFERTPPDEVKAMEKERSWLERELSELMEKWEESYVPTNGEIIDPTSS
jgi:ATPase subunit of ABC transporter with duplicated ATPase domains